ncbi:hypothetical protein L3X38_032068 [Prunus dulcis]|uniref:GAG-pre-integrase domain-containing protein n=1 Tax=Prunus dulcis TaxID=3755 RepID=A0AAD4VFI7_PRUDU|nr:hypothetical protein L3X38_032068 [Prunus dulcis]
MEKQVAMVVDDDQIDSSSLWHMRLGHVGNKALQGLIKQGVLKGAKSGKVEFCEHCILGKQTKVKFDTTIHQTEGILYYVHSDVWGPAKNEFLGEKRWEDSSDHKKLRVFGCDAYYHVKENKLDPRARKTIFLGFNNGVKGFRLWNTELKKIIVSRDVTFNESHMKLQENRDVVHKMELVTKEFEESRTKSDALNEEQNFVDQEKNHDEEAVNDDVQTQEDCIPNRKGKKEIVLPARFKDCVACMGCALPVKWISLQILPKQ